MELRVAENASKVLYAVREIARYAKQREKEGKSLISLSVGDPLKCDFSVPKHMVDAYRDALSAGKNSYAFSSGIDEAREAVAKQALSKGIKNISADNVLITNGVTEGITLAMQALLNPGENILLPSPSYALYESMAVKLGAEVHYYELDEENDWRPNVGDMKLKIDDKTRAIILINPNNPTGAVFGKEVLKQIVSLAAEKKLPIIADEVYDQLVFDGENVSIASLTDEVPVLTFNSLSKNYLATGWRTGWMIQSNIDPKSNFAVSLNNLADARLCIGTPQQFAIKAALEGPQEHIKEIVAKMKERAKITVERLNAIDGISCVAPKGTFYAFAKLESDVYGDDKQFVLDLIDKAGVVVVHGSGLGEKPGTKHFRVAYLPQPDVLHEAYDRIENFMKSL
jgi:alanine-synthesizing transaminase